MYCRYPHTETPRPILLFIYLLLEKSHLYILLKSIIWDTMRDKIFMKADAVRIERFLEEYCSVKGKMK